MFPFSLQTCWKYHLFSVVFVLFVLLFALIIKLKSSNQVKNYFCFCKTSAFNYQSILRMNIYSFSVLNWLKFYSISNKDIHANQLDYQLKVYFLIWANWVLILFCLFLTPWILAAAMICLCHKYRDCLSRALYLAVAIICLCH
jgi:hypothetical protein